MHLAIGAGKDGNLYVVNRDSMGKYDPDHDNVNVYQALVGVLPGGVFAMPAYFNNTIYYGPQANTIRAFTITNAKLSSSPAAQSATLLTYPGAKPSIPWIDRTVVRAVEGGGPNAILHAYDAATLNELYNSNQAGTRDQLNPYVRFVTPTIANGKVFVQTPNGVAVFGLLPKSLIHLF
jgi:hypothetical protein